MRGVKQDGAREIITTLASILASGVALSPGCVYAGDTGSVRETWIRDYEPGQSYRSLFACTESGYVNSRLVLEYIQQVIDPETDDGSPRYRLLLLDGHSTHVTIELLEFCARS